MYKRQELFDALANLGVAALKESLLKIEAGENPVAQSGSASIATKVSKDECRIDWNSSATEILQKIAAFSFNPGVYSFIRGEQIKISGAELSDAKLAPGELTATGLVGTGDHAIALLQVTPAGKRTMSARDWLNGFKAQPGERFE